MINAQWDSMPILICNVSFAQIALKFKIVQNAIIMAVIYLIILTIPHLPVCYVVPI